jgi:hypothetical protein
MDNAGENKLLQSRCESVNIQRVIHLSRTTWLNSGSQYCRIEDAQ